MKVWIVEQRMADGWEPMFYVWLTEEDALDKLGIYRVQTPKREFRIASYERKEA